MNRRRFGLREIELVVQECAPVNSPGSAGRAPSSRHRLKSICSTTTPPWACQLEHILPCIRSSVREEKARCVVDRLAGAAAERCAQGHTRRRNTAKQVQCESLEVLPRNAHDPQCPPARRGRDRHDHIVSDALPSVRFSGVPTPRRPFSVSRGCRFFPLDHASDLPRLQDRQDIVTTSRGLGPAGEKVNITPNARHDHHDLRLNRVGGVGFILV